MTALFGRCLSYGEGITYWPLHELLDQPSETGEECDAIARRARGSIRRRPHPRSHGSSDSSARLSRASGRSSSSSTTSIGPSRPSSSSSSTSPTRGEGPILVVCLAREELLEDRPAFLEKRQNVDRIVLDVLSVDESSTRSSRASAGRSSRAISVSGSSRLPRAIRSSSSSSSPSNLKAASRERPFPETIQALLAARLDRLGPGERAVLERGAVIGKEFSAGRREGASRGPEAVPTLDAHMQTLVTRGFLRPSELR